eukprot:1304113-Prorocentrum_lima.AAC.1
MECEEARNPKEAMRLLKGCWELLCKTKTLGRCMMPGPEEASIEISEYASFAQEEPLTHVDL